MGLNILSVLEWILRISIRSLCSKQAVHPNFKFFFFWLITLTVPDQARSYSAHRSTYTGLDAEADIELVASFAIAIASRNVKNVMLSTESNQGESSLLRSTRAKRRNSRKR
jgi:hypothetical protein